MAKLRIVVETTREGYLVEAEGPGLEDASFFQFIPISLK